MEVPLGKTPPQVKKDQARSRLLLLVTGLCLVNFFLFLVGFSTAIHYGERVGRSEADQPDVLANKGTYYRVSPAVHEYVTIHGWESLLLGWVGMAAGAVRWWLFPASRKTLPGRRGML